MRARRSRLAPLLQRRAQPFRRRAWRLVLGGLAPLVAGCAAASQPPEAAQTPAGLTDAQIAHVVVTANTIDVEMALLVSGRSDAPESTGFAATMTSDHAAVNARAAALAERLGITPEDNQVSQQLRTNAEPVFDRLEGLSGIDFDRAYLAREAAYHENVLEALDQALIPAASHPELRALLAEVRPAFEAHLYMARDARSALSARVAP